MNYLIQRGKVRGQVINVPDGLPELLSDIAREVLRCQPTKDCLCQFIIDYLHSVIVTREKALMAKGIIDRALHKVDEIIADMCVCDINKEKAEAMAAVMEDCFKRFLEKRRCERGKEKEIIRFDEDDLLDELIKKCKFSEDELKISRPLIEEAYNRFVQTYMAAAENTDGTEALYQYFRERELRRWEEKLRNQAATKIQAGFRGYMVRRSLIDKMLPKLPRGYKIGLFGEVPSELYRNMDKAARVIQKFFKERFPSYMKSDDDLFEEVEEEMSICSHHSKETIVEEGVGETAPDQKPPTVPTPVIDVQLEEVDIKQSDAVPAVEEAEAVAEADTERVISQETELEVVTEPTAVTEPIGVTEPLAQPTEPEPISEPVAEPEPEPEPIQVAEPEPELEPPVPESTEAPPEAEPAKEEEIEPTEPHAEE